MESTKISINNLSSIIDVVAEDLDTFHKAYFGGYFGNIIEAYTNRYNHIRNFSVVALEDATKGIPSISYSKDIQSIDCIPISDEYGDDFQFDFDLYFNEHEINIVNSSMTDKTVNMICEDSRIEYGLNDYDIVYIKIKDLTKEEYDSFYKTLQEREIPIIEEEKDDTFHDLVEEIEEKEDISVVQASLIGSRGWKYEDKDSDIDLRFVYVKKPEDYFTIAKQEDNITYPIEDKKDIVGYELGKFLRMICTQNPMAYEILYSTEQLEDNEFFQQIKNFSEKVLQPSKLATTYQHLVDSRIKELENKSSNNIKLYIYVLRMIATIRYLQKNREYPTCDMESLFSDDTNISLKGLMDRLVEIKRSGVKTIQIGPENIEHLRRELEKTRENKTVDNETISPKEMESEANSIYYNAVRFFDKKNKKQEMDSFFEQDSSKEENEQVKR